MAAALLRGGKLRSGRWIGHFTDERFPDGESILDVVIEMENDGKKFEAFGEDDMGICQFKNGMIAGTKVSFTKQDNMHLIDYTGQMEGKKVKGQWQYRENHGVRGTFLLEPADLSKPVRASRFFDR